MPSWIAPSTAYSVMTPFSLGAFRPSPENGTIFGPLTASDPSRPEIQSQLICDTDAAQDLELCTLLMSTEAADLAKSSRQDGRKPPFLIPSENGSSWFLQADALSPDGNKINQLAFSQNRPRISVFMDFSNTARSLYGIRFESREADLSQSISVDTQRSTVATEQFTFRIRAQSFRNASVLAWRLSSLVYFCGQYEPSELGDLMFRRMTDPGWIRAVRKPRSFNSPVLLPAAGVPLSLAARKTIRDTASGKARSLFNIDLIPSDEDQWNVGIVLRRPPGRKQNLMPLHADLRRALWAPAFDRISRD